MTRLKALLPMLLGALALFAASAVQAGVVQPCLTNAAFGGGGPPNSAITVLPINGGNQTYCQSAFGWSDSWFPTSQPSSYNQHLDVLSGDNAPSLFYTFENSATETVGSGNVYNFISPWVDGGTLNSIFIGSDWALNPGQSGCSASGDISVSGNVGTSCITLGGLDLQIVTTVGDNGVTEQFTFTNNTGNFITGLFFDDYFNFHANGSDGVGFQLDTTCPTTSYSAGVVTTTGGTQQGCSPIVFQGTMHGEQNGQLVIPSAVSLGLASFVLNDIQTPGSLFIQNNNNPCGPGDCAADLLWNLGALDTGESVTFTIAKTAPEPATLGLLGFGLLALGFFRRRR